MGNTLYVGGTGEGNYTTIRDAIKNASDGDTVFVYNGTYYENVYIGKAINLIGENKYTTIIDGRNSWWGVIKIGEDNVKISGFSIQKSNEFEGIACEGNSNIIIKDNIIRDNAGIGIYFGLYTSTEDCINNIITNNLITNNSDGIVIEGNTWYNTFNITINNNTITNNDYGIPLLDCENITIRDNNITNSDCGIPLLDCENITIRDNNITNNNNGIILWGSDRTTISYNNITNNNKGIVLSLESENNIIRNNTITNNKNESIILYHANQNVIKDNNIINNLFGLNSCNSVMNTISKNNFIGNKINAYFSITWLYLSSTLENPNIWDSNHWDSWKGFGPKIIFGGLSRSGIILDLIDIIILPAFNISFNIISTIRDIRDKSIPLTDGRKFLKIPLIQFDRNPAQEPYDIEV